LIKFRESLVSRAALYRSYGHLKQEFEQRLERLRVEGHHPDPRAAQILRLKDENTRLRERLTEQERQVTELTQFKTTAISRLAAQHAEITRLRAALATLGNVRVLPLPAPGPPEHSSSAAAEEPHGH
jgi:chromosome segregation ATPase